jgi:hypothetical protein
MKGFALGIVFLAFVGLSACDNNTCRLTCSADSDCQAGQRCLMFGSTEPFRCAPASCADCAGTCEFDYATCGGARCITNP